MEEQRHFFSRKLETSCRLRDLISAFVEKLTEVWISQSSPKDFSKYNTFIILHSCYVIVNDWKQRACWNDNEPVRVVFSKLCCLHSAESVMKFCFLYVARYFVPTGNHVGHYLALIDLRTQFLHPVSLTIWQAYVVVNPHTTELKLLHINMISIHVSLHDHSVDPSI